MAVLDDAEPAPLQVPAQEVLEHIRPKIADVRDVVLQDHQEDEESATTQRRL